MRSAVLFFILALSFSCSKTQVSGPAKFAVALPVSSVIYGIDNRQDYSEVQDPQIKILARSTVALMDNDHFVFDQVSHHFHLVNPDFKLGMCPTERFTDQPEWAFCTGSLVAPDVVLTAGHCVPDQKACDHFKLVFDYYFENSKAQMTSLSADRVFSCTDVIYTTEKKNGVDFALIRLDRPVKGRPFLKFSKSELSFKDALLIVGHPMGKPVKFALNGQIRSLLPDQFFVASLDAFSGNSGSPVFNQSTLEIVGVLARGEQDFERKNSCYVAKICGEQSCRGEDVTRIFEVMKIWTQN